MDFWATLPRKRMAAAVLFLDDGGRVLIVEPTYKDHWELPGGLVEADESPLAAARREVREELGLDRPPGRLLVVDWVPRQPDRPEGLTLLFDGGIPPAFAVAAIVLPPDELRSWAFLPVAEAAQRLSPLLARRVRAALAARTTGTVAYLEDGRPAPG